MPLLEVAEVKPFETLGYFIHSIKRENGNIQLTCLEGPLADMRKK
jgi:hypothetical protein